MFKFPPPPDRLCGTEGGCTAVKSMYLCGSVGSIFVWRYFKPFNGGDRAPAVAQGVRKMYGPIVILTPPRKNFSKFVYNLRRIGDCQAEATAAPAHKTLCNIHFTLLPRRLFKIPSDAQTAMLATFQLPGVSLIKTVALNRHAGKYLHRVFYKCECIKSIELNFRNRLTRNI